MQKRLLVLFICVVCACDVTRARQNKVCTSDDAKKSVGFCGGEFASIVGLLCGKEGYNKRSSEAEHFHDDGDLHECITSLLLLMKSLKMILFLDEQAENPLFLAKSRALSFIHNDLKRQLNWQVVNGMNVFTGAMCECCHHMCTISELSMYCKNPEKALASFSM